MFNWIYTRVHTYDAFVKMGINGHTLTSKQYAGIIEYQDIFLLTIIYIK